MRGGRCRATARVASLAVALGALLFLMEGRRSEGAAAAGGAGGTAGTAGTAGIAGTAHARAGFEADDPARVPAPIRRVLDAIDLRPGRLCFDRDDMGAYGGDRWRLQFFDAMIDRPLRIPGDVDVIQKNLLKSAERPSELFMAATFRLGTGVRRGLIGDPAAEMRNALPARDPLPAMLRALWRRSGTPLAPEVEENLRARCARLPDSLAIVLALILEAAGTAIDARAAALAPLDAGMPSHRGWGRRDAGLEGLERDAVAYVVGSDAGNLDPVFLRRVEEPAGLIDYPLWNAGIADFLITLEKSLPALRRNLASLHGRAWAVETPFGGVLLAGSGADRHAGGAPPLLLIDPAGDDFYAGGAGGSLCRPVSVVIDFGGNDRYVAADTLRPVFGAGTLGLGVLIDEGGDDTYRGGHVSLGAGLYGVGILLDRGGNDRYDGITASQGAGLFGVGILSDLAGDDAYYAWQQIQGYGYVRGAGLLVDREGNDLYDANDRDIRFPSAQSKEHNSTLGQGFGFGKRSDFADGHSLAGGIGILADGAGNDAYRCGVFGQGCAYWYGVGILADAGGDDTYDGVWYVQGSGAHFALGVLWEGGGNDRYHASMNMAIGAGHDFSLGLLYEVAGNDFYDAPNLSLGGGNANGIGLFWDLAGNDTYRVEAATALGRANIGSRGGLRDRMETIGLFLDTGGADSYPSSKGFAGNDRLWTQEGTDTEHPLDTERGAGIDTTWIPGAEPGWRMRRE